MTTGSYSDEMSDVLRRPIIIIGSPRSGTTFLGQVLKRHRELVYIEEPRLTWKYGNDRSSDKLNPEDARPEIVSHIRSTFSRKVKEQGGKRLLEKTPSNSLRMGFVDRVFPDCQFIHITRNPLDSIISIQQYWMQHSGGLKPHKIKSRLKELDWKRIPYYAKEMLRRAAPSWMSGVVGPKVWGPRIPGVNCLVKDLDLMEVAALQWRMCVESAIQYGKTLPADRYMQCRLEDMGDDLMRRILAYCDLPEDEIMWEHFHERFKPELRGARKKNADKETLDKIIKLVEPTMIWMGYYP